MKPQISLEGYPFTEKDLRQVCAAYVEQLCKIEEPLDFEPSQAHREAIRKIMDDALKQGKRRAAIRRIAAAVAVVLLIGSMVFVTNASARDRLENWLRQVLPDKVVYQFFGKPAEKLYEYTIGWLPEGFELVSETKDNLSHTYVFRGESFGCVIDFIMLGAYDVLEITGEKLESTSMTICGMTGELFYNEADSSKDLILFDEARRMVITVNSRLPVDDITKIVEGLS